MRTPFADRMEEMRALTELSQRAFARRIGMSESAYRKWLKTTSQISGDSTRKVRDHIPISYEEMLGHGPLPEEAKAVLIGWRDSGKRRGRPAKPAQVASDHPGGLEQFHAKLRSLKDGLERLRQLARDLPDVLAQDLSKMSKDELAALTLLTIDDERENAARTRAASAAAVSESSELREKVRGARQPRRQSAAGVNPRSPRKPKSEPPASDAGP